MRQRPTRNLVNAFVRHTTGVLELNRPKALNSLNHEMVEIISEALDTWRDDDSVHRVVICSSSERGFCAGGDVRTCREEGLAGDFDSGDRFFRAEYEMNRQLADFPKAIVSVIDGVAMGGGLGVSVHGSHRVITEKAFAAMPEMAIGFIPDVGTTWMMQRMIGESGEALPELATFLGVTGWRMTPADMLWSGLATDLIASEDVDRFIDAVIAESLDDALEQYARPVDFVDGGELEGFLPDIRATFGHDSWAAIDGALEGHGNADFVARVRDLTEKASPTSVVAAVELYTANRAARDIVHALDNEFAVGSVLRREHDFPEGVRAVLVDKDRSPTFDPSATGDVDVDFYRTILKHR
ncbi:enoyl-CoA hydratase/isomerase family protein [Corynebacterium pygosceleis]|uniref:3-hydroxyisobutyryl-CoA hydrolase n=1 Tax=Corynebacterium pygosceleis TaxID=2800406 RepID=A0A9Q4C8D3_9CORY|nr:enoyl-CoA hydratase/isomerase family protein [Corynebacterium pygosceleis]MCK7638090.1 enoyl-CoA hydratase/isomerase family protein [Corynebacterium pygosceleis]MCL0120814.1 enoyl-CoA hydratase/isomerase family protein [Corynebacterium pygosceleis]MCX7444355.1 enoyl-CoA hydratase/isomerase family protein [Corynebacterium pygosceleis]MCX7468806.1 enoyl-CoA hydratase/isomerase family protein [Corynebacterium pygosceleis]